MKKLLLILLCLPLLFTTCKKEDDEPEASGNTNLNSQSWNKIFGGTDHDRGYSVQQTTDGGYIITGYKSPSGNGDVWLIKTDKNGDSLWTKTFGGIEGDIGKSVQQTTDEGYIICGETFSFGNGNTDFYLIKTDENGVEQWNKTFGGTGYDRGYSVQQTTDMGFIITGYTTPSSSDNDV